MNPASKPDVFRALLARGLTAVMLDARRDGVILPEHLRGNPRLRLDYGYSLNVPIRDLDIDEFRIRATLSFGRTPTLTVVPWSAVWMVCDEDGRGVRWKDDEPTDADEKPAPKKARHLRSVD